MRWFEKLSHVENHLHRTEITAIWRKFGCPRVLLFALCERRSGIGGSVLHQILLKDTCI